MVHVSCCLSALAIKLFPSFGANEREFARSYAGLHKIIQRVASVRKRLVLSAAAAAGVSVAFGSPLGGVLFGLEELDLFSNERLIWTAFVTSVIASGERGLSSHPTFI